MPLFARVGVMLFQLASHPSQTIGEVIVPAFVTVSLAEREYVPAATLNQSPAAALLTAVDKLHGVLLLVLFAYVSVPVVLTYRVVKATVYPGLTAALSTTGRRVFGPLAMLSKSSARASI